MFRTIIFVVIISACFMACGDSGYLANVNGKKISTDEFDAYLEFKRLSVKDDAGKKNYLDDYLDREALAAVIEKEEGLNQRLNQAELNEFRKEMLISRYFENFLKEQVTEQAVRNYYNTHADEYEKKKVHVAHILIRTNKKMSELERKAKLTTAQEAYSKIMADEDFAKIAEKYSEDRVSSKKGGDLGWIKEGGISKKFSETAFTLKKDEVSQPFETPFGFHIVKVLDEAKVIKQPFDAVAGNIRYQLRNSFKQAETERLKKKMDIKRYE